MNTHSPEAAVLPVDMAYTCEAARLLYRETPRPATAASAGTDLRAAFEAAELVLLPGQRAAVPTGVRVQPRRPGWAGFVYSRSGLGARDGVTVAQGVGVIDPDYTGEITVCLLNTSGEERRISRGERVAQLIFQPFATPLFTVVEELSATGRGAGGFGHTGR